VIRTCCSWNRFLVAIFLQFDSHTFGPTAGRALDELNFSVFSGRVCRIMLSQPGFKGRYAKDANIFVQNLPETLTNQEFHKLFAAFGRILSAKVRVCLISACEIDCVLRFLEGGLVNS
jgi:hypothetical protein